MRKSIILIGGLWTILSLVLITIGAIFWFHFPYLLFLDEWHLTWMILTLCVSLLTSQILIDRISYESCTLLLTEDNFSLGLKPSFIKIFWSLLIVVFLEIILGLFGISRALMGLVTLGIGASFFWSSRFYWVTILNKINSIQS